MSLIAINENFSYVTELLNMGLTLIFILGLAFFSLLFLKKIMRSKMRSFNSGNAIKILERRALNPKASIYLVDILGKGVVIGESQTGGIQFITEFAPGTDVELLLATELESAKEKSPRKKMGSALQKLIKRQKIKK